MARARGKKGQSTSGSELRGVARPAVAAARRRWSWAAVAFLVVVGFGVYLNSLGNSFVFDDVGSIVENPNVRRLWPLSESLTGPAGSGSSGRPVLAFTLALNYALGGLHVLGYHLLNIALHVLAGLTLLGVVRRTLLAPHAPARLAAQALPLAVVVALLWLVHPLHTAALDHVVYRSEVLVGLFYLLTLYATMRAATSEHPRRWSLLAVVACFLGAGSKEVMATAPVVVLLHDRTFVAGSLRAAWQDRRALYVGLASSWILLAFLMATGERGASVGLDIEAVTPLDYARTQLQVVLHYVRLTFWPEPLVLHYRWDVARSFGQVAAPGLGVAVLVGLTAWALVRRPALGFLGAWFFAILAPTSSFVPLTGAIAAEHRCYLPLAAVTAVVVLGGAGLLLRPGRVPGRGASILGVVLAVAMAATLAALTVRRNRDYRSQESIWRDVLAERPSNVRAHNDLGSACLVEGRIHEALAHYTEALRIEPHYGAAHDNLGSALVRLGRLDEAAVHFEEALRVDPDYAKAHCNLASLRTRQGRYGEALRHLEEALRIDPLFGMAHYNWGHVLLAQGQLDSAITRFEVAAERAPHYAEVHHNLAAAFLQKGEYARALEHYRNTLEVEPEHGGALNNLAWLLATCPDAALRDGDAAVRSAEKALRVAPDESPGLLDTQAAAYAEAGRFENAVATAERARALAARAGNTQLVRKLEERLQLYRAGKAYRMAPARSLRRVR